MKGRRLHAAVVACVTVAGVLAGGMAGADSRSGSPPGSLDHLRAEPFVGRPGQDADPVRRGLIPDLESVGLDQALPADHREAAVELAARAREAFRATGGHAWSLQEHQAGDDDGDGGDSDALLDRVPLRAADLNADGRDDLQTIEVRISKDLELLDLAVQAQDATDGASLWRSPAVAIDYDLIDLWLVELPDLDGSGAPELIELSLRFVESGDPCLEAVAATVCAGATWHYEWNLRMLGGEDGAPRWDRTYQAVVSVTGAGAGAVAGGGGVFIESVQAAAVLPYASDDHDADGLLDLVLNRLDLQIVGAWAGAGFVSVGDADYSYETWGEVVSGDGAKVLYEDHDPGSGLAYLLPLGDAFGDSTGDLAWLTRGTSGTPLSCVAVCVSGEVHAERSMRIDTLDGATFAPGWSWSDEVESWGIAAPAVADIDGDGAFDVLAVRDDDLILISGRDGAQRWTRNQGGWYSLAFAGNVDGGPGTDLLAIAWGYDPDLGETVTVDRIDGAGGTTLLTTTYPEGDVGSEWLWVWLPGDLDGDGVAEIAHERYGIDPDTGEFRIVTVFESGKTGTDLYEEELGDDTWFSGFGDVDADGRDEVLRWSFDWWDDGLALTYGPFSLDSGELSWSRTDQLLWDSYLDLVIGSADLVPGVDLYDGIAQYLWNVDSGRLDAIETQLRLTGGDGTIVWTLGDVLTLPPPPPPPPGAGGSISGTVLHELGEPAFDVCVHAFTASGQLGGWTITGPDGTFAIDRLLPGDLRIEFVDCGSRPRFHSEWYDDVSTFEEATPIAVTEGAAIFGIDATLALLRPPPNDDVADAIVLEATDSDRQNTLLASTEVTDRASCAPIGRTVWYRFTPETGGTVTVNTFGSNFDTVLAAFIGTPLTEIACNDEGDEWLTSEIEFPVVAGVEFYVMAAGWYGDGGELHLNISPA